MTFAALARGLDGTANTLVVDTPATAILDDGSRQLDHHEDKLHCAFGRTYITVAGDSMALDSLMTLLQCNRHPRLNLRERQTFEAVLTGIERHRTRV